MTPEPREMAKAAVSVIDHTLCHNDRIILELAVSIWANRFDKLIGICMERQPTRQEIARFRAYLPPSAKNAYGIKP